MPKSDGLTEKALRFCDEYIVDFCGTKAAIRAGYAPKSAAVTAAKLLKDPRIQAENLKRVKELQIRTEITADNVVKELALIAFMDPRRFFDEHGALKEVTQLDEDVARGIASMEIDKPYGQTVNNPPLGLTSKIKFCDKVKALEALGRKFGIFKDNLNLNVPKASFHFHWGPEDSPEESDAAGQS